MIWWVEGRRKTEEEDVWGFWLWQTQMEGSFSRVTDREGQESWVLFQAEILGSRQGGILYPLPHPQVTGRFLLPLYPLYYSRYGSQGWWTGLLEISALNGAGMDTRPY